MKLSNVEELSVAWAAKRLSQLDSDRTKTMAIKGFIEGFRTACVMLQGVQGDGKIPDMEPLKEKPAAPKIEIVKP